MMRILVAIVFALSILTVSLAHAATPSIAYAQTNAAVESADADACKSKSRVVVAYMDRLCVAGSHHKSATLRCQVDIAPLVSASSKFAAQHHGVGGVISACHPKDWVRKPALAPPRHS